MKRDRADRAVAPVFVVSGATGASGELLVRTALAQFRQPIPVVLAPNVRSEADVLQAVAGAAAVGGTIVHTLVAVRLRRLLTDTAQASGVPAIDLMGALLEHLAAALGEHPVEQPGLYRQQREAYFRRIDAIEFSVAHDDGQRPGDLSQADIVLVGVSRTGKTPLAMHLAVTGWKVANVPFIREIEPPAELLEIDPGRVVGLTIEPGQLIAYRKWRHSQLGVGGAGPYCDPAAIFDELLEARRFCRRCGFAVVDVTDKPIESSADEVLAHVMPRLPAAGSTGGHRDVTQIG